MYELKTDSGTVTNEAGKDNSETGKTETRKGNTPIYVWVTPSEKQTIGSLGLKVVYNVM